MIYILGLQLMGRVSAFLFYLFLFLNFIDLIFTHLQHCLVCLASFIQDIIVICFYSFLSFIWDIHFIALTYQLLITFIFAILFLSSLNALDRLYLHSLYILDLKLWKKNGEVINILNDLKSDILLCELTIIILILRYHYLYH